MSYVNYTKCDICGQQMDWWGVVKFKFKHGISIKPHHYPYWEKRTHKDICQGCWVKIIREVERQLRAKEDEG